MVKIPLGLAGISVAAGQIGGALGSTGLQAAGSVSGKFIPVAINVGMGGKILKDIKKIVPTKKKVFKVKMKGGNL